MGFSIYTAALLSEVQSHGGAARVTERGVACSLRRGKRWLTAIPLLTRSGTQQKLHQNRKQTSYAGVVVVSVDPRQKCGVSLDHVHTTVQSLAN